MRLYVESLSPKPAHAVRSYVRALTRVALILAFGTACGETIGVGSRGDESGPAPAVDVEVQGVRLEDGDRSWSLTGVSLDEGANLRSVPGHGAFWFAWSVFHPGTEIFGASTPLSGQVPAGTDRCTVPCEQIQPACGGRDCIPALVSPEMVPVGEAPSFLRDSDEVVGVLTSEGPRAYPHNVLWWHEIVNESVGGLSYAVTYCPLTGSGLVFDRLGFVDDQEVVLGVSGNLYNSNLTMYDRLTRSWWSQMRLESVLGPARGRRAPLLAAYEMTWQAWRTLHPDTLVVSERTGHTRDYDVYPYGGYRTDDENTFRVTDPKPDPRYPNKDLVFGVFVGDTVRGYPWTALEVAAGSRRGVVRDEVGGVALAVVFDLDARYVHAFALELDGELLDLQLVDP